MPTTTSAYQPLPTQDSPNTSSENLPFEKPAHSYSWPFRVLLFVLALVTAALAGYTLRGLVGQKSAPSLNSDLSKPSILPAEPVLSQPSDMLHENGKLSVG
jgi:hypothetical protein